MKRLLLCFLLLTALTAFAAPADPSAVIHREIDKLVALYTDGLGYHDRKWRHVSFGSLFESHSRDAVVFFSLGGVDLTNVHQEFIAIFAQGQGRNIGGGPAERSYHLVASAQVGKRWVRTFDWNTARISKGRVVVQGTRWGEGDPGCCPTQAIEVTFTIPADLLLDIKYPLLQENEKLEQRPATGGNK